MPRELRYVRCLTTAAVVGLLSTLPVAAIAEIVIPPPQARSSFVSNAAGELAIQLTNGDRVVFKRSDHGYSWLRMTVAGKLYTLDLVSCQRIGPVVSDTLILFPDDESRSGGTFTLLFAAGSKSDLKFGELPRVQISFHQGEPRELLITRKTSERAGFSDRLCSSRSRRVSAGR